ncbi:MAG: MgtC/SapB family protein, partial [Candidatus Omnitrophica bacterium]|nr:MgtC/SapB family protein [Candidatus Omnitrophota bacterium]
AGAVIRFRSSVQGLTTAASIWTVAAIGLAVGAGLCRMATVTTVIVLVVLLLSRLEKQIETKKDDEGTG